MNSIYLLTILFLLGVVESKISGENNFVSITNEPDNFKVSEGSERQYHNQEGWLLGQVQAQAQAAQKQDQSFGQTGPFNFYNRIPQVLEVAGLGLLFIRTFGIATGVPYFYPVFIPLLFVVVLILSFIPNEELNFPNLVQGVVG